MTAISFPRPSIAVRDLLREYLGDGVTVSTKPVSGSTGARALPWVQVVTDGRTRDSRLNGRATVRLVGWHVDEGAAEELLERAEALLLSHSLSSPAIRSVRSASSVFTSTDEEAEVPIASCLLQVHLRPREIS